MRWRRWWRVRYGSPDRFRQPRPGEQAGLVTTEKVGRVRTCKLGPHRLEEETVWLERHRQLWASRFDALDNVLEELKQKEKANGRKKRK
jgi:hypothetical protein